MHTHTDTDTHTHTHTHTHSHSETEWNYFWLLSRRVKFGTVTAGKHACVLHIIQEQHRIHGVRSEKQHRYMTNANDNWGMGITMSDCYRYGLMHNLVMHFYLFICFYLTHYIWNALIWFLHSLKEYVFGMFFSSQRQCSRAFSVLCCFRLSVLIYTSAFVCSVKKNVITYLWIFVK